MSRRRVRVPPDAEAARRMALGCEHRGLHDDPRPTPAEAIEARSHPNEAVLPPASKPGDGDAPAPPSVVAAFDVWLGGPLLDLSLTAIDPADDRCLSSVPELSPSEAGRHTTGFRSIHSCGMLDALETICEPDWGTLRDPGRRGSCRSTHGAHAVELARPSLESAEAQPRSGSSVTIRTVRPSRSAR